MKQKIMVSWSTGKDSAWALYTLQQDPAYDICGIFCTINQQYQRTAMHAVRVELLKKQAECLGLQLDIIELPWPCDNETYGAKMQAFIDDIKRREVAHVAFGDLFLEDVRDYRVNMMRDTGITPVFPIWNTPTDQLANQMVEDGLKTVITCVDPRKLPATFAGRFFDKSFLDDLPADIDPCGENGEFHSFVYDGPMFKSAIDIQVGDTVERDGFVFADVMPV